MGAEEEEEGGEPRIQRSKHTWLNKQRSCVDVLHEVFKQCGVCTIDRALIGCLVATPAGSHPTVL